MICPAPPRCPSPSPDHDAELLFIADAGRLLVDTWKNGEAEALRSVMAMLNRQQRLSASRAFGRPVDP